MSAAVDNKVVETDLGLMGERARKVPTMAGWCRNDAAPYVSMDVTMPEGNYTMDDTTYNTWWDHFRQSGFTSERDLHFNPANYSPSGNSSASFMAACDAFTTTQYMCPVY